MGRKLIAAAAACAAVLLAAGTSLANTGLSEVVDPRTSPITFGDPVFGGPRPDELRLTERAGMSIFTLRYLRDDGQTLMVYSRAGDGGEFVPKHAAPSEVRERFIPPGGTGRAVGGGTMLGAGRIYAFERYEMGLSGNVYGCFVATSVASGDVLIVNQCRTDAAVPAESDVMAMLSRLHVLRPPAPEDAIALGGKRI